LFLEPWYALDEINLYLRCMALSRPISILHWQLTDTIPSWPAAATDSPCNRRNVFSTSSSLT